METLLAVNVEQWKDEMASIGDYLSSYGERLPADLMAAQEAVVNALNDSD